MPSILRRPLPADGWISCHVGRVDLGGHAGLRELFNSVPPDARVNRVPLQLEGGTLGRGYRRPAGGWNSHERTVGTNGCLGDALNRMGIARV